MGHHVDLFSTDGVQNLPDLLKGNLIGHYEEHDHNKIYGRLPDSDYDCQISYTTMKNFPIHLCYGNKNRFGVWCYEFAGRNILPSGFAKYYKSCDLICAPSDFAKKVFIDSGVPESSVKVISHGINADLYKGTSVVKLPTSKKYKILANIAQAHTRKNIPGLLEAYGRAFCSDDDVSLILKGRDKKPQMAFEVSINKCLNSFNIKYPKHAEIKLFNEFIPDISSLYRSVDSVFTMAHSEGFFLPGLEGIAAGKLVIAPNWGGQIDFLNDQNSLLISGVETTADPNSMYWENKHNAIWFDPSVDDAAEKLKFAYNNYERLNENISAQREKIYEQYNWINIAKQFLANVKSV